MANHPLQTSSHIVNHNRHHVWTHDIFASSHLIILSFSTAAHVLLTWFICYFSIPVCSWGLSRAIHPHYFSRPVGAQFAHCITCLATSQFVSVSVWAYYWLSASFIVSHRNAIFKYVLTNFVFFYVSYTPFRQQGSAESSTYTFLVAWSAHRTLFWSTHTITTSPV